jgi:outer membrane protein OmpA-like peptidoglycan-associated protein
LKFGVGKNRYIVAQPPPPTASTPLIIDNIAPVQFTIRAPQELQPARQVKETFPLRNSVFFDQNATAIPPRYTSLSQTDASAFTEKQLYQSTPINDNAARSSRQLEVHHNFVNIIGYRMKINPKSTIKLNGSSYKKPAQGKQMAENIKTYLVNIFGINGSRITTEGSSKPMIPSEQWGTSNDLILVREEDKRVDISSNSPELLMQLGGDPSTYFKPIQISSLQEDPTDNYITFSADGAADSFKSWMIDVVDEKGNIQHYGPFKGNRANISSKTILGASEKGTYKVTMTGQTNAGIVIKKESSISLIKSKDTNQKGLRYSILFDIDKSTPIDIYEKFIINEIVPQIPDNAKVIIHGHTDIVGEEKHNFNLSNERAMSIQKIIETALTKLSKTGIRLEAYGFGEDASLSPFANNFPEERFYNRTVIIDIISSN